VGQCKGEGTSFGASDQVKQARSFGASDETGRAGDFDGGAGSDDVTLERGASAIYWEDLEW
jgi:hypothetical protein